MQRQAYQFLLKWKSNPNRKPLIIQGARQVGKTWIMKEFGRREFHQTAYFNFESSPELSMIFKHGFDTKRIIASLEIHYGKRIDPINTLLVFDEIQDCPDAITSLKYFYENAPEYHVFGAGSLLGVAIHHGVSFPVGKVDFFALFPLSFYEYLDAIGADGLLNNIKNEQLDILSPFKELLTEHLKKYMFLGGMPEVVHEFIKSGDFIRARELQLNIIRAYENDFSKHAPISQLPKIRMIWQSIVGQLAKENSKFIYAILRNGARAKDFETAIDWLKDAGLIHKVVRISKAGIPITAYADWASFKIYLSDVGLLGAMSGISQKALIDGNRLFEEFKGILAEQFVCQTLINQSYIGYYWTPDGGKSEVDFVIQKQDKVVPIEVKSADNVRSRSLKVYYEKYMPTECVRTSLHDYEIQSWMKNIPLYYLEQWLNENSSL